MVWLAQSDTRLADTDFGDAIISPSEVENMDVLSVCTLPESRYNAGHILPIEIDEIR